MVGTKKWQSLTVVTMVLVAILLSIASDGCFKRSSSSGSSAAVITAVTMSGDAIITSGVSSTAYTAVSRDAAGTAIAETYTWSKTDNTGTADLTVPTTAMLTGKTVGTVTMTATGNISHIVANKTVTVVPGAVTTVTVSGDTNITIGISSTAYTAVSKDAYLNTVTETYTWSEVDGTGSADLTVPATAQLTGKTVGTVQIRATGASTVYGSKTVNVVATRLVFTVQPTDTVVDGTMASFEVTVQDVYGVTVTDATDVITINGTGLTLGGNIQQAVAGVATFNGVTIGGLAGLYTLIATSSESADGISAAFDLTGFGAADKLAFTTQPVDTVVDAIAITFTVTVQDTYGNAITDVINTVVLAGDGLTLVGDLTVDTIDGVVTFTDITIGGLAGVYTLTASATGLTDGISAEFNLTGFGVAANLAFTTQPITTVAGLAFNPVVVVTVRDTYGNTTTDYGTVITITQVTGIDLTFTQTAVSGVATFTGMTASLTAATNCTLTADDDTLTPATSDEFDVQYILVFTAQPTDNDVGVVFSPVITVQVQDGLANPINGATDDITLAINQSGALGGTNPVAANGTSGTATFTDLTASGLVQGGYILTASAPGLAGATSAAFALIGGFSTAAKLAFATQPVDTEVDGTPITCTVIVQDVYGNRVENATDSVVLAGDGLTLVGVTTVAADAGVVTFTDITIGGLAGTYTLTASSGTLTDGISAEFNLTGFGAVDKLAFATQPVDTAVSATATAFAVTVQDTYGNEVITATNVITITGSAGLTLGGTISNAAVAGVATFDDIQMGGVAATYTLTASADSLTDATSDEFALTFGAAAQLAFATQPVDTEVDGTPITCTVIVQDVYGNRVEDATDSVVLAGDGLTLVGVTTVAADAGVVTFTDITIGGLADTGYTLTATATGLTEDTSNGFDLTGSGALANYLVEVTVNPIGDGITGTGTATALDAYGNITTTVSTTLTMTTDAVSGTPTVIFYTAGDATGTVNNVYSTWSGGVLTFYYTATVATEEFTITATDDDTTPKTGTSVTIAIN